MRALTRLIDHAAEFERVCADVRQAIFAEFFLGPALGLAHLGRVGHASADPVGQIGGCLGDLATVHPLVDDPVDLGVVVRRGAGRNGDRGEQQRCHDVTHEIFSPVLDLCRGRPRRG